MSLHLANLTAHDHDMKAFHLMDVVQSLHLAYLTAHDHDMKALHLDVVQEQPLLAGFEPDCSELLPILCCHVLFSHWFPWSKGIGRFS